jgi:FMN-dependent NADH-azoreductase
VAVSSPGGAPNERHEHAETYLRSIFSLVGISDIEVIVAEGLAISPEYRDTAVQGAIAKIEAIFTSVA